MVPRLKLPRASYCSSKTLNFLMKCMKFYNGFILKILVCIIMWGFADWVTYMHMYIFFTADIHRE